MPGTKGPATSLWPLGRVDGAILYGKTRLDWVGTLLKYAIALAVGAASLGAALQGVSLAWAGVGFTLVFLFILTRSGFSSYELRLEGGSLTRAWKPLWGAPASRTTKGAEVLEIRFARDVVSSVTMVMKNGEAVELDRGTASEPLEQLARDASRELGVKLT